jgi:hypothetical protein
MKKIQTKFKVLKVQKTVKTQKSAKKIKNKNKTGKQKTRPYRKKLGAR